MTLGFIFDKYLPIAFLHKGPINRYIMKISVLNPNEPLKALLDKLFVKNAKLSYFNSGQLVKTKLPRPDILLVFHDNADPELWEHVSLFRQQKFNGNVPIIVLSTALTVNNRMQGLQAGASVFVNWPVAPAKLNNLITALSRGKISGPKASKELSTGQILTIFISIILAMLLWFKFGN